MLYQELDYLAPHVWRYPLSPRSEDPQPNIGILKTPQQTILIDAGNSPRHARYILSELTASGFPPVKTIILTHHHWDHTLGAQVYDAATIIAHEACAVQLRQMANKTWQPSALREEALRLPQIQPRNQQILQAVDDWRDFHICLPTITFTTRLQWYPSPDMAIECVHVGGVHAADSIVVKIPSSGVMFLGDCFYPPVYEERTPANSHLDVTMLESLLEARYTVYVDGHGKPRTYEQMHDLIKAEQRRMDSL
jgi:glyoxylase-like metal-dependent hydrolase (beta-lactamase superfamily II)